MHLATSLAGYLPSDIETTSTRRRPRITAEDRTEVYARPASTHCAYCITPLYVRGDSAPGLLSDGWRTVDHVTPLAHGGRNDPSNMVAACTACNKLKGDQTLAAFEASDWLTARRRTVVRRAARNRTTLPAAA